MLPKILRMRRELVVRPRTGAAVSIALVAMVIPALLRHPGKSLVWTDSGLHRMKDGALALFVPPNACGLCAISGPVPGRQEKPRAHVTVRRSRYVLDGPDIRHFLLVARGGARAGPFVAIAINIRGRSSQSKTSLTIRNQRG